MESEDKNMNLNKLISKGAKFTKKLTYEAHRPKTSGYMWGGDAVVILNGITFYFEMWYHGGDTITEEEARGEIALKGIRYKGKFYDTYWHTFMTEDEIWLHPTGWFNDRKLDASPLIEGRANYNFQRDVMNAETRKTLAELGFTRIV